MSKARVLMSNIIHVKCLPKWRKLVPGVSLRANKFCCLGRCSRSGRYATLRNIGLAIWEACAMINLMRQSVGRDTPYSGAKLIDTARARVLHFIANSGDYKSVPAPI
jgi:hypothetical protein